MAGLLKINEKMGNIKELVSFKSMFINLKQTCSGRKLHEHNYYEGSRHICLSGGPTLTFSFFLSAERGFVVAEYVYLQQSFCLFKNAFNLLIYRQTCLELRKILPIVHVRAAFGFAV